jgi:hypothetical protein
VSVTRAARLLHVRRSTFRARLNDTRFSTCWECRHTALLPWMRALDAGRSIFDSQAIPAILSGIRTTSLILFKTHMTRLAAGCYRIQRSARTYGNRHHNLHFAPAVSDSCPFLSFTFTVFRAQGRVASLPHPQPVAARWNRS